VQKQTHSNWRVRKKSRGNRKFNGWRPGLTVILREGGACWPLARRQGGRLPAPGTWGRPPDWSGGEPVASEKGLCTDKKAWALANVGQKSA